jgi:hypothetical protein
MQGHPLRVGDANDLQIAGPVLVRTDQTRRGIRCGRHLEALDEATGDQDLAAYLQRLTETVREISGFWVVLGEVKCRGQGDRIIEA